jgi:hypothetical protein
MKKINHWAPTGFCAFICFVTMFGFLGSSDPNLWRPMFFPFLPLCFMFVGYATMQMHCELRELRQRITELEEVRAS